MPSHDDPLLSALLALGRFHGIPVHPEGAVHGLPLVNGKLSPALFCRAARRCGFQARIVKRSLDRLHEATFPLVLLLTQNRVAVLAARKDDGAMEFLPLDDAPSRLVASREEAEAHLTGYAILVKPVRTAVETGRSHWFWGTLWRFRGFYGRVAVATFMINVLALAGSLFVMNVYDRVVPNQATDTLWVLAAGVCCAYGFELALKTLRTIFVDRAGHRVDLLLGGELFARMLGMRLDARPGSAGTLAGQARSYEALREFFASATVAAMVDLPFVFGFAFVVWLIGGVTAVPMVVGAVAVLLLGAAMQIPISSAVARGYQAGNLRQALFVEGLQGLEWIKAVRAESGMQARFEECVHESAVAEGKGRGYSQLALNLTALGQQLVSVAIVVVAYFQVLEDKMTMGAMIGCVILSGRAMAPLAMVASILTRLQQSRRSLQGLDELMALPLDREEGSGRYLTMEPGAGAIEAKEVTFAHGPDQGPVLKGVTFTVRAGERVAILGRIGSGKSTLLRILLGLYPCQGGAVTVGGLDLRQIDPAEWRRRVGFVPQDPWLLSGTLRSNLTAGCPGVSDQVIRLAVRRAGLESFVQGLPRGLDHPVTEGGRNLSGGQRQALSLARAWLECPTWFFLDEPTGAIDQTTERVLLRELGRYLAEDEGRTLIVATHRRSILQLVDRVIVIDGGRVIADGPKHQVLGGQIRGPIPPRPQAPGSERVPEPEVEPASAGDADLALAPTYCPDLPSSASSR